MHNEEEDAEIQQCLKELLYMYYIDGKETKEQRGMSVLMILDTSGVGVSTERKKGQ